MLPTARGMATSAAALRRLLLARPSPLAPSGNPSSALALRTLSTRIVTQKPRQLTPARETASISSPDAVRGYATTTTKTKPATKRTAGKKKSAAKKKAAPKKKKAAKKKKPVAKKKPKKKVVKKLTRPKIHKLPSAHGIHGYTVYVMEHVKTVPGGTAPERMQHCAAQWRALSDAEKAVIPPPTQPISLISVRIVLRGLTTTEVPGPSGSYQ